MLLIIDNYDSFTYNLVHLAGSMGYEIKVFRNDQISVDQVMTLNPSHIIISPGPGWPENAGISKKLIRESGGSIPILGVCLGHQAIGEVFGARVIYAPRLVHGKSRQIFHPGNSIFMNIPNPFKAGRYHSLIISGQNLPSEIIPLAYSGDGQIMSIKHKYYPLFGVQFHPESILTEFGDLLIQNFLQCVPEENYANL